MSPDLLVNELLSLNHAQRVGRLVEVGTQSRTDPELAAILTRWEQGDWQERQWALTACWGSRDTDRLARMVSDPSRILANLAIRLLAQFASDDLAVRTLGTLTGRRRRRLLLGLRCRQRFAPVSAFVQQLQAQGDPDARRYHGLVSGQASAASGGPLDRVSWQRRAKDRPQETADLLVKTLNALRQPDGLLAQAALAALTPLSVTHPDLALDVIRALSRFQALGQLPLLPLLSRRPAVIADLVLASPSTVALDFGLVARRLDLSRLLLLLERRPGNLSRPEHWLRELTPADRVAVFERFGAGFRDADGCVAVALLALLPATLRIAEARRHLALPILATRPLVLAGYLAFLPWDEAWSQLEGFLQHPEAEMRGAGWQALTTAARYHGDHLGELLTQVRQRQHEQDPVRLLFLTGLADLPPQRWTAAHLSDLSGVVRDALDATDLSGASTHQLARLIWRLLPHQPAWAVEQLAVLFRERGAVFCLRLQDQLTDSDARRVEEALAPVYEDWGAKNRGGWLLWVANCLGCRLRVCPRLLAALRDLLKGDREFLAIPALELLRQYLPGPEFETLLTDLLKRDRGWAAVGSVFRHLYHRRQDLLQSFLDNPYIPGRLGKRDLLHYIPLTGHQRLTAPQQQTLGRTLSGLIRLPPGKRQPKDAWTVLLALDRISRVPAADHTRLLKLASDERPLVREAALRALGRLDTGEGLPTLLEALGDERARVAIYAVRTAFADLPAERVLTLLRDLSLRKVTVAKEALRLAGEFGGPSAFDWLEELAGKNLHRDVRIALLRALWDHLERPEAWSFLNQAASAPDGRLLAGVLRIPADNLSESARGRLIELLLGLTQHTEATVRLAALQRFASQPVPDPQGRLLDRALTLLASPLPDERSAAGQAVLATATAADSNRIAAAMTGLLPQRKPLTVWLVALAWATECNRERLAAVARASLAVLQTDPITICYQPALAVAADGLDGLRALAERLLAPRDYLDADALGSLDRAIEASMQRPDRVDLERLESEWAGSSEERLRRLAVTALRAAAQDGHGWTEARRARLERYRNDPARLVAAAAQFTFP
jgi:hypothetical protein